LTDERAPEHRPHVPGLAMAGLLFAMIVVFYLGIVPGHLLSIAADSVSSIF
jgi:hypothetical protein